jgi:hypothetical protein
VTDPRDSEKRRQRDAEIRSLDEQIAEHLEIARQTGELQGAASYGKPLADMEGWAETPAEFRLPFKVLKNAGVVPPEIELFHRRAALRRQLAECGSESGREALSARLAELEQVIALRLESLRVTGSV